MSLKIVSLRAHLTKPRYRRAQTSSPVLRNAGCYVFCDSCLKNGLVSAISMTSSFITNNVYLGRPSHNTEWDDIFDLCDDVSLEASRQ